MSRLIKKEHNVSILLYHFVCPAKYHRVVFDEQVDQVLKAVCLEISERYEIGFIEIGTVGDHVHFLIQSVPSYSLTKIIRTVKSLSAREVFIRAPHVKKQRWGREFWSDGYYVSTVGGHGSEQVIQRYAKEQGQETEYRQLYVQQLRLL